MRNVPPIFVGNLQNRLGGYRLAPERGGFVYVAPASVKLGHLIDLFAPRLRVLSGHTLLDRPVRWVHATDLMDPSPYLKAGEMVLTNGVWRRRPADSERFVLSLTRAGAIALGFGVRSASARTPADLIAACQRASLPLIQIPHDMPFSALSEAVTTYFADERQRGLVKALQRDQAVLTRMAQGAGLGGVLEMLARDHDLRLALLTHGGQVLAFTPPEVTHEKASAIWRTAGSLRKPADVNVLGDTHSVFPITLQGRLHACLVCWTELEKLTEEERSGIDQELAFIGVELAHARTNRDIQQRFVAELLDLIDGGAAKLVEVARRLRSLGVDPEHPMTALAIEPIDAEAASLGPLSEAAERYCESIGHSAVAPQTGRRVIVIACVTSDEDVSELAHALHDELGRDGWDVRIGAGGMCTRGIAQLQRSVVQAEYACSQATTDKGDEVTAFRQVGSYAMLFDMQDAESRTSFISTLLGALTEHDRKHRTRLVESLDVYLSTGANWQRAANRLHVHVNTLRYRMGQIERITGRDLTSMDDRVSFYIALRGSAVRQSSPNLVGSFNSSLA